MGRHADRRRTRAFVGRSSERAGAVGECRAVTVRFEPVTALAGVSLRVQPGSRCRHRSVGAGKSTLLWTLAGAVRPSEGQVTVGSTAIVSRDQAARLRWPSCRKVTAWHGAHRS
jgi:ABC-type sugar transport system ATPase subunit